MVGEHDVLAQDGEQRVGLIIVMMMMMMMMIIRTLHMTTTTRITWAKTVKLVPQESGSPRF